MSEEAEPKPFVVGQDQFRVQMRDSWKLTGLYLTHKNRKQENPLLFDKYFNPDLANDSEYFKSVSAVFDCVNKHAG